MPVHYNVHKLLSAEDLPALEDFARHPARTVDECHEWTQAHGYVIGRTAIYKWKKNFHLTDRFAASSETARAIMDAAKNGGTAAVSDAAMAQLAQVMFEKMISLDPAEVNTKELWSLSAALRNLVQGKRYVEKLRGEMNDALKVAEKDARKGATGEQVMARVRELLGIASDDGEQTQGT